MFDGGELQQLYNRKNQQMVGTLGFMAIYYQMGDLLSNTLGYTRRC